jgi:hypothetical protein
MKIKEQVESILKYDPASRNSDKRLLVIYMQKAGMNLTPEQIEKFKDLPSTETIRRIRQKLQEQGKYPAKEEINEARYEKFKAYRKGNIEEYSDVY